MTQLLKLRDYQAEAIDAVRQAWANSIRRPAIVLPTGVGKTVIFAHLAAIMHGRGVKTLILAHRDELVSQAADKLRAVAPGLRVGIYKADRREVRGRDVIVASVQSTVRAERRAELARAGIRLVIVDECHHAVANTYMETLRDLGAFEDDPLVGAYALGVTATLGRSDRIRLDQVWQDVVYRRDILDMIKLGYLVNAKGIRVRIDGLDLRKVRRQGGDFQDAALAEAMHDALAPKAIARAYREHAQDRQGLVFAPTVGLAYEIADAFRSEGLGALGVDGATPLHERRAILGGYARGDTQVISNCAVLTEGYDAPWCSAVVIARPTSSAPLYVQMAGRGLRPYPGKQNALIIDVVGVTGRHRLASVVDLAGADRVEKLPPDLAEYDELDLFEIATGTGMGRPEKARVDGPLVSEIVDLFTSSRRAWLRTTRGVWFLSTKEHLIFLAPGDEPGLYHVARCPSHAKGGEFIHKNVDLDMAMSWGEQCAAGDVGVLTQRSASWRKSTVIGPQQLNMALSLGIDVNFMTKGELSDAISHVLASRRLDVMPCNKTVTERGYW
jgi:superfamily II DNA or RNA helicase